jgi:Kef-type K+ transport system membrane component KefB
VLVAYFFDLTAAKTKIPSVIILFAIGWAIRQLVAYWALPVPDLSVMLPILGSLGLILVVMEGSLELEIRKSKLLFITKSFVAAFLPIMTLSFLLALFLQYWDGSDFRTCLINSIPFAIISSAIAIPSVKHLNEKVKEFTVYESSFSDIIGVMFFNFVALNTVFNASLTITYLTHIIVTVIISLIATLGLSFLLNKIDHQVKFIPIILFAVLIYSVLKIFHFPELLFILIFGLILQNIDRIQKLKYFRWIEKLNPDSLQPEIDRLKDLVSEGSFLIRSLFFLLFGYLLENKNLFNPSTLILAMGITATIFIVRALLLFVLRLPLKPMLFIAPRGLITILLFISILPEQHIGMVTKSLLIQVIIITSLIMTAGLMISKTHVHEPRVNSETRNSEKE